MKERTIYNKRTESYVIYFLFYKRHVTMQSPVHQYMEGAVLRECVNNTTHWFKGPNLMKKFSYLAKMYFFKHLHIFSSGSTFSLLKWQCYGNIYVLTWEKRPTVRKQFFFQQSGIQIWIWISLQWNVRRLIWNLDELLSCIKK